jgi:hypothetical protein
VGSTTVKELTKTHRQAKARQKQANKSQAAQKGSTTEARPGSAHLPSSGVLTRPGHPTALHQSKPRSSST